MSEKIARSLEHGGNGSTLALFFTALGGFFSDGVIWLNENHMAVMALCAIVTCIVGVYGTIVRIRIAKTQRRRSEDK